MIAIIDYDAGNIGSVRNACDFLGYDCVLTRSREELLSADHVILPGVGSFGDAMRKLRSYDLESVIKEIDMRSIPLLGICLGQQLMFERSDESPDVPGLGLLKGTIRRIPDHEGDQALKIPHMGWNNLTFPRRGRLFKDIDEGSYVYFVHSYYLDADDKSIVTATTHYGTEIEASIESGSLFACQFHPEKSGEVGLRILKNFLEV